MERMTSWARPTGMTNHGRIRGLVAAGLLCAALAGCGAAAASTTSATAPAVGGARQTPFPESGCASANQATSASVERHLQAVGPLSVGTRTVTQHNTTKVRALFRDFCAALATAGLPHPGFDCAAREFGSTYTGTFYDGQRVLATFIYSLRGCPQISLTALGHTRATFVLGKAAAAAPHLKSDFAAVLGLPESQVYGSPHG
jgi:hypothetical protein